jgi:hypothetical protein
MSRLKNYDIDYFEPINDNEEETRKTKKKETVHSKIAKQFGDKLILMKSLFKGERYKKTSVQIPLRMEGMIEEIIQVSKPKYRTESEIIRTGVYNGICQIYESEVIQGTGNKPSSYYMNTIMLEPIFSSQQMIDDSIFTYIKLRNLVEDGIMEPEIAREHMDRLLECLPKKDSEIARKKIEQILNGKPLRDVFFHRESGGGRKGKDASNGNSYKYTMQ